MRDNRRMRRCGRRPSLRRDERGQVLALFAGGMVAMLMLAAFTIDAGYAWWAKRALQSGADAAALAGARDLANPEAARAVAYLYSGDEATSGAKNKSVSGTVATVCVPGDSCGVANKIIVTQTANIDTFFWRVFGRDNYDVSARAVASFSVTATAGSSMAIFVEESCGNKGLIAGAQDIWIEGNVHSNGHVEIGGSNFRTGRATYWRPLSGNSGCKNQFNSARFNCEPSAIMNCATWVNTPTSESTRRPWPTGTSITESTLRGTGDANCTTPPSSNLTPANIGTGKTYCYGTTDVTLSGNFASGTTVTIVTRGGITLNGTGRLKAARDNVLFFRDTGDKEIVLNPGTTPEFVFEGYIINRSNGIKVNQVGVTTPSNGYLEAKWVDLNGAGFKMFGLMPDSSTTTTNVQVNLEE